MIEREEKLIEILKGVTDVSIRKLIVERHILILGALSEECHAKVDVLLR